MKNPLNPTEDINKDKYYTEADIENYVIGTDTWFKPYNGLIKKQNTGENRDIKRLQDLTIASIGMQYWVAHYRCELNNLGVEGSLFYAEIHSRSV